MTVNSIEIVQKLIEEMQADQMAVDSAWEYTNAMNNKKMFAVFPASHICDVYASPYVEEPELIWTEGKFIGEYAHLNEVDNDS